MDPVFKEESDRREVEHSVSGAPEDIYLDGYFDITLPSEKNRAGELLPESVSLTGSLSQDLVHSVVFMPAGELLSAFSATFTRFSTFRPGATNSAGQLEGFISVYEMSGGDESGLRQISRQGFRSRYHFPPTIIPLETDNAAALVIEDGNPLPRAGIAERKRYGSCVSLIRLGSETSCNRDALQWEHVSTSYSLAFLLDPLEQTLLSKGKRVSSWVEGLRGYDGAEVLQAFSLTMPRFGPRNLVSRLFRRDQSGDPSEYTSLAACIAQRCVLVARPDGIDVISPAADGSDLRRMPLDIPNGSRPWHVALSGDATTLAVATSEGIYVYEVAWHPSLRCTRKGYLADARAFQKASGLSLNSDGRLLAVSGTSVDLFEIAHGLVTRTGSVSTPSGRFIKGDLLVTNDDNVVITFDLSVQRA